MAALLVVILFLFVPYAILIIYYWRSWQAIPFFHPAAQPAAVKISVLIPARNEEMNIGRLLHALEQQDYPRQLFEVIVIDDHSADDTAAVVRQFAGVRLLSLQEDALNSYKKKAIEKGIAAATGELIVTTDADCEPGIGWLSAIAACKQQTNAVFIVAPVVFDCNSSVVEIFQAIDFMVLQGITGASVYKGVHSMCNGANLAYERAAFFEVGGFSGIDSIASGDDMLLMHKIATRYPGRITYLKSEEALIHTQPMKSWGAFINQRIRWASKARFYEDKRIMAVLLLVYLFNFSFLVLLIMAIYFSVTGSPQALTAWLSFAFCWIAKTIIELPFFAALARFFHKRWAVKFFFLFQPLHIGYTILAGFLGSFGKYEWKGRRVR